MPQKILVVDDEVTVRDLLKDVLSRGPYDVLCAESAEIGLGILENEPIDVIVSDEKMPGMHGSEFLSIANQKYPDTIRIILTGHASLDAAIRAINEGQIYRFFTKPCNVFDLGITIRQALQQKALMRESRKLLNVVKRQYDFIAELENQYPGITKVEKGAKGEIILDDESDPDSLIREIGEMLEMIVRTKS